MKMGAHEWIRQGRVCESQVAEQEQSHQTGAREGCGRLNVSCRARYRQAFSKFQASIQRYTIFPRNLVTQQHPGTLIRLWVKPDQQLA